MTSTQAKREIKKQVGDLIPYHLLMILYNIVEQVEEKANDVHKTKEVPAHEGTR